MNRIFVIFLIMAFVVISCKKDENTNNNLVNQKPDVEKLILSFKDKLQNHLKDGGTYNADSAVWYVEALLNYTHGYATANGCTFTVDTAEIVVNNNSNSFYTIEQLASVYDYLDEQVTANMPVDSYIFAIDVELSSLQGSSAFSAITGYAKQCFTNYKSLADTSGYWFWGRDLGMCGPDSGLYVGTDAADILEALVNATADYDYFTNLESHGASYFSNYIDPNFPFNDPGLLPHRIFAYQDTVNLTDYCISPNLMNYYSGNNGLLWIVRELKPGNKSFAYCTITDAIFSSYDMLLHVGSFTYGSPNDRE